MSRTQNTTYYQQICSTVFCYPMLCCHFHALIFTRESPSCEVQYDPNQQMKAIHCRHFNGLEYLCLFCLYFFFLFSIHFTTPFLLFDEAEKRIPVPFRIGKRLIFRRRNEEKEMLILKGTQHTHTHSICTWEGRH